MGWVRARSSELTGGTGEVPDLTGIDHCQRVTGTTERGGDNDFKPACRFQHNQRGRWGRQIQAQCLQALGISGNRETVTRWANMNIKTIFRDVDADKSRHGESVFHDPSLQMRARDAAQATVRAPIGTGRRGTMLRHGLGHPRLERAPVFQ